MVTQVLRGLRFPAEKWQILTQADLYGADTATRQRMFALPVRLYRDCPDVARALPARAEKRWSEDLRDRR